MEIQNLVHHIKTIKLKPLINTYNINNIILQFESNKSICISNYKKNLNINKNIKLKCNKCDRIAQYSDDTDISYCWSHAHTLL